MTELWTEKYAPSNAEEFIGNSEILEGSLEWARKWSRNEKQPPLLLWGNTGSGKTALAYLVAKLFNWDIVELNSSDLRSKDVIERVVGAASQNASFSGARRLTLLDEADALTRDDRGGASAIAAVIKDSQNPIILTANDIFANKSVSQLRFICKTSEFKKINYLSVAKRLREILSIEGVAFDEEAVKELARNSDGDMRSALLDAQTLSMSGAIDTASVKSLSPRERQQKVFSVMKAIFKGTDFSEVRAARSASDLENDMVFRWVEENIPRQYHSREDIALAFERLSRADIFNGRIYNRQHWGFLRYSSALAAEGVALSKETVSHDFTPYQFPTLLSTLSKSSAERSLRASLGKKIGSLIHSSSREVVSRDLPFLREMFSQKELAVSLAASFELDEKELAFLLVTKPDSKKVKDIFAASMELRAQFARPKKLEWYPSDSGDDATTEGAERPVIEEPAEDSAGKQTKLF